jgi:DNA repair protein RecN (Recombination protein N)
MIQELRIENFAIIDQLDLSFSPGLVILTGETGAGKSIIIDAVEALLGSRTDTTMVRAGAEKSLIEATFAIPGTVREPVLALLKSEELQDEPESEAVVLAREIRSNGRSVARVNGRTVSVGLLKQLGEFLVDVHGQSEHLSLLRVSQHLGLLDSFANVDEQRNIYSGYYRQLQALRHELTELRQAESEAARRIDMLNFQIAEIDSSRLKPDEEESLREERNRLANAEGLASMAQQAVQALDEGTPDSPATTDLLGQAAHAVSSLARLDPAQASLDEQAQDISERLRDLVFNLRAYLEGIEFNPKRLDQVEERLNLIQNLKRKYGKGSTTTIQDVLVFADTARQQLDTITHASERIEELEAEEAQLLAKLSVSGQALSKERHTAAVRLAKDVEAELEHLQMSSARFQVDFHTRPDPHGVLLESGERVAFDIHGLEQIEFLVAPNPGEGLKPLVKIASGGETSRLMLAIKNVLANADQVPTLIFDEIDQGIGGRVGGVVGHKLWRLARRHQVLCVTHLPQLAAFGDQHLQVQKILTDGRTITQVQQLENHTRLNELALMMGDISAGTRRSAQELLQSVQRLTGDKTKP